MACLRPVNTLVLALLASLHFLGENAQAITMTKVPSNLTLHNQSQHQSQQRQSHLHFLGQAPSISQQIETLIEQGLSLYREGKYLSSQRFFEQASDQAQAQKDILNQGLSQIYLSLAQQQLQNWPAAQHSIKTALNQLTSSDSPVPSRVWALAHNTQGRLSFSLGQTHAALQNWEQAEDYYAQSHDPEGVLGSIVNQAQALTILGYHHRACKSLFRGIQAEGDCNLSQNSQALEQTIAAFQNQSNPRVRSLGLLTLGNLLRLAGNYEASEALLISITPQTALEQSSQWISLGKLQQAYFNRQLRFYQRTSYLPQRLKTLQRTLNHAEKSIDYFQKADQLPNVDGAWPEIQNKLFLLRLLVSLDRALGSTAAQSTPVKDAIATIPSLKQAILDSNLEQLPPSQSVIQGQLLFAQQLLNINSDIAQQQALQYARLALAGAKQIEDPSTQSQALGVLGAIYENSRQWPEAQRLTQQAVALANAQQDHEQTARWHWQIGRIYQAQGDRNQSLSAYQQAVHSLGIVRKNLRIMQNDVEFSFLENVEPVYRQYVSLLLNQEAQTQLKQVLQVFDDFQIAELEDFLNCNLQLRAKSEPDATSAFIYPIVLNDRIEIIIEPPNNQDLIRYTTPISAADLEATLKNLRRELEQTYQSTQGLQLSQQLYDWVLRPAQPYLTSQNIKTLVFILDGPLRNIPISALHDGNSYLIEQGYQIALLPGLELFEPQASPPTQLKALTFGLAEGRDKPPLPAVIQELSTISTLMNAKKFLDQSFSKQTLTEQLATSSVPIVHLATHGQFSSNPDDTYISTYDQDLSGDELSQILQSRTNDPNLSPIELLVLSACKTATGDPRAVLGLAGIAIQSGARSTLSSLWAVNDESTAILMSQFYRELTSAPTITKAEALRRAQVQLLKTPGYASPRYWAAFVLVGNWR